MNTENRSNSLIIGFMWRVFEHFRAKGAGFIVSIILPHLLAPELYGTIALVIIFASILNVFVDEEGKGGCTI